MPSPIAHELNHLPRKTHGYRTPAEVYAGLLNPTSAVARGVLEPVNPDRATPCARNPASRSARCVPHRRQWCPRRPCRPRPFPRGLPTRGTKPSGVAHRPRDGPVEGPTAGTHRRANGSFSAPPTAPGPDGSSVPGRFGSSSVVRAGRVCSTQIVSPVRVATAPALGELGDEQQTEATLIEAPLLLPRADGRDRLQLRQAPRLTRAPPDGQDRQATFVKLAFLW